MAHHARAAALAVLLGLLTACAATPPPFERPDTDPAPAVTEVPVTLRNDMPEVRLDVGGRTLRMILDLGGTDAVTVTESALRTLDPEFTGRTTRVADAFGNVHRSREFVLSEVRLGGSEGNGRGLTLTNVRGHEITDGRVRVPGEHDAAQFDGYIGVDLLRQFHVLIDYPAGRVLLCDPAAPPPVETTGWAVSPFRFSGLGVTSTVELDGRDTRAVWDTGASHTVVRTAHTPATLPRWDYRGHEAVTFPSLAVGGRGLGPFDAVLLDFAQPPVGVILGTNLFREHAVWLDFTARQLAIDPG